MDGLMLARRADEPRFDDEDRAVVALFLAVYGEAWRPQPDVVPEWVAELPPRLRRVFELLLTELSEKEIAAHTGLSYATTHQYVVEVYRRGGITSRAQLMARLLRPAAKYAS
jgi:DNA-binding NarL/FixJ family response regulator